MTKLVSLLVVTLSVSVVYMGYAEWRFRASRAATNAQIERLALSVDRLARMMERVLQEQGMADINLTEGDIALNHAQTVSWSTGTQTVMLTVYAQTSTETRAQATEHLIASIDKWQSTYPPNAPVD